MFDLVSGMLCFVTATVSFLYGTRICWICGKKCDFATEPAAKKQTLMTRLPAAFVIYSFGFFIVFTCLLDGALTITVLSLISALLLSHFVISMAMPLLKRPPAEPGEQADEHAGERSL